MTGKLEDVVATGLEPVGYRLGWASGAHQRIATAAQRLSTGVVLTHDSVQQALCFQGWWRAVEEGAAAPHSVPVLRKRLTTDVAVAYLQENAALGPRRPIDFVRDYLSNESNFDPLTATWLHLQRCLARTELCNHLAACIALLTTSWPQVLDPTLVTPGPTAESVRAGAGTLIADNVHAVSGAERIGVEASWPGSVLVRFVIGQAFPVYLEEMDVSAVAHSLATGCPPQRLVAYSLTTGTSVAMDVERDWIEGAVAGVAAALDEVHEAQSAAAETLSPGDHCGQCPMRRSCAVSEADQFPF